MKVVITFLFILITLPLVGCHGRGIGDIEVQNRGVEVAAGEPSNTGVDKVQRPWCLECGEGMPIGELVTISEDALDDNTALTEAVESDFGSIAEVNKILSRKSLFVSVSFIDPLTIDKLGAFMHGLDEDPVASLIVGVVREGALENFQFYCTGGLKLKYQHRGQIMDGGFEGEGIKDIEEATRRSALSGVGVAPVIGSAQQVPVMEPVDLDLDREALLEEIAPLIEVTPEHCTFGGGRIDSKAVARLKFVSSDLAETFEKRFRNLVNVGNPQDNEQSEKGLFRAMKKTYLMGDVLLLASDEDAMAGLLSAQTKKAAALPCETKDGGSIEIVWTETFKAKGREGYACIASYIEPSATDLALGGSGWVNTDGKLSNMVNLKARLEWNLVGVVNRSNGGVSGGSGFGDHSSPGKTLILGGGAPDIIKIFDPPDVVNFVKDQGSAVMESLRSLE